MTRHTDQLEIDHSAPQEDFGALLQPNATEKTRTISCETGPANPRRFRWKALNGIRIFVTGNYFPVLRDVLTSIAGDSQRVMLGNQSISRLTNLLKC
ncbi:hypothetical protein Y032_0364g3550 [Ancylostoma ceylanicum]|uniref:Uncharacterized protein n=1 Tax=Ancylostoma ceylanicum TaxID=53326 RepID=A0A016RVS4_9BILA|nr:hypothetical protein Y032_0364g3550 [Ancylostoma ceylanicum]